MRMSRLTLVLVLLLLSVVAQPSNQSRIQGPSGDFSSHKVVRPRVYHGRSKREITSTRESDTDHTDTLSVGLELDGVARILDLRLNTDLIPVGYKERYQHQGAYKTHTAPKVELCHYQGSIRDMPGSWAAVSTCHGLKGVIYDGENLHHIQPEDEHLQASHYLYKHSDLITNHTCGYKGTSHHIADEFVAMQKASKTSRHKRATETIRGPYNANRQSRYVELVFVIDKNEYMSLGENLTRVHHHCKDIANIINALYTPLNIFIALVGVEVWTDADEITLLKDGDVTLNNFLQYRRERLVKTIPNDNAQLLTKLQFSEGVVGKALKGPICTYEFSGGVSVDHSNVVGLVAATVAHEMGHNFGMEHDSAECVCPEEKCIMAGSSGSSGPTHWSSCSLEYLALAFEHGMDYCLRNKPQRLFDSPVCGNGFVEPGEQCDCGLVENCDNPCCNASTCMLHSNASCATGECCDLKTCKPKTAGTECRSADQECDLPEYCTGQSEYCPSDVFKIDGETCNMGKAFCYQGSCRTHNDQCKLLWGPTGSSSDSLCYEMNNQGTKNGNCGFNRTGNTYIKCHDQNILCGMLHCKHLNERLEFGMESVAILSHSFLNSQGKIIACRSAIVDLGLNQVDPGLAPDGAKCAPGKMCVNQKCMPVADLRMQFPNGKACPNNCSGNGVCNSLGHCHCNRGYQPPDCTEPGVGGSQDSGPAQDPNARSEYIMSLYIIFLGIVPTLSLISFGVWYARNNGANANQWKKGSGGPISTYVSCLDCFSVNKRPKPPAKIRSKKSFLERAFSRTNANANKNVNSASLGSNNDKVYTISERLGTLPRDKIRIVKRDLVSTTNPEAISCSNEIEYRRSLCADAATVPTPQIVNEARNPAKRASPLKTELGIKLAEHIKNLQQTNNPPQPKNFKGLTLKTDLKFEQLRESPSTSSNVTPQIIAIASASNKSSEPLLTQSKIPPTVGNKPPAFYDKKPPPPPFYDKKPPPPPVPPQSLKPKNFRKS